MSVKHPKHARIFWLPAIALILIVGIWPLGTQALSPAPAPAGTHGPYSTNFSRAENPISEGGRWLNGQTDGLDWTNVRTTPGFALGTEIGGNRPDPQKFDDSTALLKGTWGPNQTAQATVRSVIMAESVLVNPMAEVQTVVMRYPRTVHGFLWWTERGFVTELIQ